MRATGELSMRVGDAERRVVDDRLMACVGDGVLTLAEYDERAEVLWRSRTRPELAAIVADLPPAAPRRRAATVPSAALPSADERCRGGLRQRLVSRVRNVGVGGLLALAAVGVVASGTDERVVFGSGTQTVLTADPSAHVSMLFGSVRVVVPDDAVVDASGFRAFGSLDCRQACDADTGGKPGVAVDVRAYGAFGSVQILTQAEVEQERRG